MSRSKFCGVLSIYQSLFSFFLSISLVEKPIKFNGYSFHDLMLNSFKLFYVVAFRTTPVQKIRCLTSQGCNLKLVPGMALNVQIQGSDCTEGAGSILSSWSYPVIMIFIIIIVNAPEKFFWDLCGYIIQGYIYFLMVFNEFPPKT